MEVLHRELHFSCPVLLQVSQIAHEPDQFHLPEAQVCALELADDVVIALRVDAGNVVVHASVLGVHQDVIVMHTFQLGAVLLTVVVVLCQVGEGLLAELWNVKSLAALNVFSEPVFASL